MPNNEQTPPIPAYQSEDWSISAMPWLNGPDLGWCFGCGQHFEDGDAIVEMETVIDYGNGETGPRPHEEVVAIHASCLMDGVL